VPSARRGATPPPVERDGTGRDGTVHAGEILSCSAPHRSENALAKSKRPAITWTGEPAAQDYPAAASYLRLLAGPALVDVLIGLLRTAPPHQQQAKDILRAARLPLLAVDDPEVVTDLQKIRRGKALSPILLVAGDLATGRTLQVADGYHRACASYHVDEDAEVPCRVATLPAVAIS